MRDLKLLIPLSFFLRGSNFCEFRGCFLSTKMKLDNITALGINISVCSIPSLWLRVTNEAVDYVIEDVLLYSM